MKEISAQVEEVRPGRHLFVRKRILGIHNKPNTPPIATLVIVHGSCATEKQFHPLLKALDHLLINGKSSEKPTIHCVLYDMLGCGQSEVPNDWDAYSGAELQMDLGAIVEQHTDPSLPLFFMAHSYAPSMLIHWILGQQRHATQPPPQLSNIQGFIFFGSCVQVSSSLPYPNGGHPVFRLPVWVLKYLQPTLTNEFLNKAIHPTHKELRNECMRDNEANDMHMVKAFYRQTRWATPEELQEAVGDTPVLQFHGVSDEVLKIEWGQQMVNHLNDHCTSETAADAQQRFQAEFVPMEKASHLIMMEQPAKISWKLIDFLCTQLEIPKFQTVATES